LATGLADAFFTPFFTTESFEAGFLLEDLVDLAFFLVAFGMLYPVNSKKAVKYGSEVLQSQVAQCIFLQIFS